MTRVWGEVLFKRNAMESCVWLWPGACSLGLKWPQGRRDLGCEERVLALTLQAPHFSELPVCGMPYQNRASGRSVLCATAVVGVSPPVEGGISADSGDTVRCKKKSRSNHSLSGKYVTSASDFFLNP